MVSDASLNVADGSIAVFIGSNGAGKTTTLRAIAGLIPQPDATINPKAGESLNTGVSLGPDYVPDSITLTSFLKLTRIAGLNDRAPQLLSDLGLDDRQRSRIGDLSTGMRQKVALLAAFRYIRPAFILDEPYNGLDPRSIDWLNQELRYMKSQGSSVLLSSHLLREAAAVADSAFEIEGGVIRQAHWPPPDQAIEVTAPTWARTEHVPELEKALLENNFSAKSLSSLLYTNATVPEVLKIAFENSIPLVNIGTGNEGLSK